MNIHYIQHVPFEGLGSLKDWVNAPGKKVTATKFYEDERLPFVDLFDLLIILGGPMAVHDQENHPWLIKEKQLIEKALTKGKKVVGICLGAQLIADVLGAKVYKNEFKEVGWFPVNFTDAARKSHLLSTFPQSSTVFHWHGDTFDTPNGAVNIGSSEGCANQGFVYNDSVLALQFHLEMTTESIQKLMENCPDDLAPGKFIQKQEELINNKLIAENYGLLTKILKSLQQ